MKSLNFLTIFATARMMAFLETLTHKPPGKKVIRPLYKNTYDHFKRNSTDHTRTRTNRNGIPSPNARCGFATGDAF